MRLKKDWGLQLILDKEIVGKRDLAKIAEEAIGGGATIIQLRDKVSSDNILLKEAKGLRRITKAGGCIFIVNDRVDIAIASDADGVHLGQDDLPYEEARRLIGDDKLVGISTHSLEEAAAAQALGADYIGVGPIFATTTKLDLEPIGLDIASSISEEIAIPAFFIGGITAANVHEIIERGARHIAVASAILNSKDIAETTREFVDLLESEKRKAQSAKPKFKTQNVLRFKF